MKPSVFDEHTSRPLPRLLAAGDEQIRHVGLEGLRVIPRLDGVAVDLDSRPA
jgi:hypothetical protein